MMRRIAIFGVPGTGKTTLARALSQRLGVPHHDLDEVLFGPHGAQPLDEFRGRVRRITAADAWIADGNYSKLRDLTWRRAFFSRRSVLANAARKWMRNRAKYERYLAEAATDGVTVLRFRSPRQTRRWLAGVTPGQPVPAVDSPLSDKPDHRESAPHEPWDC